MVPQFLHQLKRKAIGKRGFVEEMARTLLYNLKGTSYGQSVRMIYRSKSKRHRKSLVMERLLNSRSCSEPQRISKLLYRFKTVDIYLQIVLYQCFHR